MGDAIFRVAADVADYVNKMSVAERATKRVAKSATDIGTAVTGSIIKVALLQQAFSKATQMMTQMLDKAKSASESSGDRAKSLTTSFLSMGFRDANHASGWFMERPGIASNAERVQLARQLAEANKERRQSASEAELNEFLTMGAQGGELTFGTGFSDLIEGFRAGGTAKSIMADVSRRKPGIALAVSDPDSPLFQHLRAQAVEGRAELAVERNLAVEGADQRIGEATNSALTATAKGRVMSAFEGPIMGAATGGMVEVQKKANALLEDQLRLMRGQLVQPNFATDTQ